MVWNSSAQEVGYCLFTYPIICIRMNLWISIFWVIIQYYLILLHIIEFYSSVLFCFFFFYNILFVILIQYHGGGIWTGPKVPCTGILSCLVSTPFEVPKGHKCQRTRLGRGILIIPGLIASLCQSINFKG